jgi:hypothetical protein
MTDSLADAPGDPFISVQVKLGTSFILVYKGCECEVRLGRRITITDQGTYIQHSNVQRH